MDGGVGGHLMEVVVPLVRRRSEPSRVPYQGRIEPRRTRHGLGGPWLYLKLRTARRTQDDLVRGRLGELVEAAASAGAERWFFIRYTEGGEHWLRVRFGGPPDILWSAVAPAVGAVLAEWERNGVVAGHLVDQYDPEVERYGGPAVQAAAERLFQEDSTATVRLLRMLRDADAVSLDREEAAAVSLASLAHAFGPPAPGQSWVAEFADDPAAAWLSVTGTHREVPDRYRADREAWRALLDPVGGWPGLRSRLGGESLLEALAERDAAAAEYGTLLRDAAARGEGATPQARVAGSLMHMTCNRLFGGDSDRERDLLGIVRAAVHDNRKRRRYTR
ncbi:thiopeptide-type bacteriocin biosynthesis protein [Nocardiopsis sp. CNT-189]|uniref:thiopeptide-type bacteriocin biosynthesis protein n=1 Tax=Nocardiopsis oceanisediminis TaxID=2816862 RepID=UPI003B2FCBBA